MGIRSAARAARLPSSEGAGTVVARWRRTAAIAAAASWLAGLAVIDAGYHLWRALLVLATGLALSYSLARWGIRIQIRARVRKHLRKARSMAFAIRSSR